MEPLPAPVVSCSSPVELRAHLDAIDQRIVAALAQRAAYARQAERFSVTGAVSERQAAESVVARARALARTHGADPEQVEAVYRVLVSDRVRAQTTVEDALQAAALLAR